MTSTKRDESDKDTQSTGQGESKDSTVITPEVVKGKRKPYSKSRKGVGGRPNANPDLDRPVVKNFIAHLLRRKESDAEIARLVNCPPQSFNRWKKKNIELWDNVDRNSTSSIKDIENALIDTAKGFYVERPVYNKDGSFKCTKFNYYPPNQTAIQYYLNNRSPQDWKARVEHNHTIEELPLSIIFEEESPQQIVNDNKPYRAVAVTDDYGDEVYPAKDGNTGNQTP